jgi:purine nucleoside permease
VSHRPSGAKAKAVMEALPRATAANVVGFGHIISMRSGSNFECPWLGSDAVTNLLTAVQGGFEPAQVNLYRAGITVIEGILEGCGSTFAKGVDATNCIGE